MFKPFDATMRDICGIEPAAWPEFLGFPIPAPGLIELIESNLSTITAEPTSSCGSADHRPSSSTSSSSPAATRVIPSSALV